MPSWQRARTHHSMLSGLNWKNRWYMPLKYMGPFGSFIQYCASDSGVRAGRSRATAICVPEGA